MIGVLYISVPCAGTRRSQLFFNQGTKQVHRTKPGRCRDYSPIPTVMAKSQSCTRIRDVGAPITRICQLALSRDKSGNFYYFITNRRKLHRVSGASRAANKGQREKSRRKNRRDALSTALPRTIYSTSFSAPHVGHWMRRCVIGRREWRHANDAQHHRLGANGKRPWLRGEIHADGRDHLVRPKDLDLVHTPKLLSGQEAAVGC